MDEAQPEEGSAQEQVTLVMKGDSRSLVKSFNEVASATKNVVAGVGSLYGAYRRIDEVFQSMSRTIRRAGYALTASGAGMAWASASFERNLYNVQTVTNDASLSVGNLTNSIYRLSSALPQDVGDLSATMYDIASAGFTGSDALEVLGVSAKAASAGLAETRTSARALTAIMQSYGMSAKQVAQLSDVLFQTVNVGVISFEELAASVGDWAALASQAGIKLTDATAAMAAMTRQGVSAAESSTQLRMLMLALIDPTEAMTAAFSKLGANNAFDVMRQKGWGLKEVLDFLHKEARGNLGTFEAYFGEVRSLNAAMQLTGKNGQLFAELLGQIGDSSVTAGATQRALAKQSQSLSFQFKLLMNRAKELVSIVGRYVIPIYTQMLKISNQVLNGMIHLIKGFDDLIGKILEMATFGGSFTKLTDPLAKLAALFTAVSGPALVVLGIFLKYKAMGWVVTLFRRLLVEGTLLGRGFDFLSARMKTSAAMGLLAQTRLGALAIRLNLIRKAFIPVSGLITGVVVGLSLMADTLSKTSAAAKEYASSMSTIDDQFDIDQYSKSIDNMREKMEEFREEATGGFAPVRIASMVMEMINPFGDDPTVEAAQNTAALNAEMGRLAQAQMRVRSNLAMIAKTQAYWNVNSDYAGQSWSRLMELQDSFLRRPGLIAGHGADPLVARLMGQNDSAIEVTNTMHKLMLTEEQLIKILSDPRFKKFDFTQQLGEDQQAEVVQMIQDFLKEANKVPNVQDKINEYMKVFADRTLTAEDRVSALNDALNALTGTVLSVSGTQAKFGESLRGIVDTVRQINEEKIKGDLFDPLSEAGARFTAAMEGAQSTLVEMGSFAYAQTGSIEDAMRVVRWGIDQIREAGRAANLTESQINLMIAQMGLTPDVIEFLIKANTTDAERKMAATQAQMAALDGQQATVKIGYTETSDYRRGGGIGRYDPTTGQFMAPTTTLANRSGIATNLLRTPNNVQFSPAEEKKIQDQLRSAQDFAFNIGIIDDATYIAILKARLGEVEKFSAEWFDIQKQIFETTRNWEDRLYQSGMMSTQQYQRVLSARLASLRAGTQEYVEIQRQMFEITRDHEDRMHQYGAMSTQRYGQILRDRLKTLVGGTQDYFETLSRLRDIQTSFARNLYNRDLMNRQQYFDTMWQMLQSTEPFTDEWFAARDAVGDVIEEINAERRVFTDPIRDATDMLKNLSDQGKVTAADIGSYFNHMIEGADRWRAAVETLGGMGLNSTVLKQLAEMGPSGLNLAEEIVRGGPESVAQVNRGYGTLEHIINTTGLTFGGMFPSKKDMAPIVNNNFDIPAISIEINGKTDVVTAPDVQNAIGQAIGELAEAVRRS